MAPGCRVRLQLHPPLSSHGGQGALTCWWQQINPESAQTVRDLLQQVVQQLNLGWNADHLVLVLDGYALPHLSPVSILRDGELLQVATLEAMAAIAPPAQPAAADAGHNPQAMAWQAVQDAAVAIQREQQQQQQYAAVQAAMQYVNAAVEGQQQQQQQYAALPAALPAPQPEPSRKQQGQQQQQQGNDRPAQAQGPGRSKKRKRTGASKQGAGTQATGQITQDPGGPSGPPSQPQGAAAAADAAAEVVGASDGGDGEGAPAAKRPSRSARRKAVKRQLRRAGVLPYIPGYKKMKREAKRQQQAQAAQQEPPPQQQAAPQQPEQPAPSPADQPAGAGRAARRQQPQQPQPQPAAGAAAAAAQQQQGTVEAGASAGLLPYAVLASAMDPNSSTQMLQQLNANLSAAQLVASQMTPAQVLAQYLPAGNPAIAAAAAAAAWPAAAAAGPAGPSQGAPAAAAAAAQPSLLATLQAPTPPPAAAAAAAPQRVAPVSGGVASGHMQSKSSCAVSESQGESSDPGSSDSSDPSTSQQTPTDPHANASTSEETIQSEEETANDDADDTQGQEGGAGTQGQSQRNNTASQRGGRGGDASVSTSSSSGTSSSSAASSSSGSSSSGESKSDTSESENDMSESDTSESESDMSESDTSESDMSDTSESSEESEASSPAGTALAAPNAGLTLPPPPPPPQLPAAGPAAAAANGRPRRPAGGSTPGRSSGGQAGETKDPAPRLPSRRERGQGGVASVQLPDYQSLPVLVGQPSVGDVLAYQLLEIGVDFTPQVSAVGYGQVATIETTNPTDPTTTTLLLTPWPDPSQHPLAQQLNAWRAAHAAQEPGAAPPEYHEAPFVGSYAEDGTLTCTVADFAVVKRAVPGVMVGTRERDGGAGVGANGGSGGGKAGAGRGGKRGSRGAGRGDNTPSQTPVQGNGNHTVRANGTQATTPNTVGPKGTATQHNTPRHTPATDVNTGNGQTEEDVPLLRPFVPGPGPPRPAAVPPLPARAAVPAVGAFAELAEQLRIRREQIAASAGGLGRTPPTTAPTTPAAPSPAPSGHGMSNGNGLTNGHIHARSGGQTHTPSGPAIGNAGPAGQAGEGTQGTGPQGKAQGAGIKPRGGARHGAVGPLLRRLRARAAEGDVACQVALGGAPAPAAEAT